MVGSPLLIAEKARARLRATVLSLQEGRKPEGLERSSQHIPDPADLVITACEVSDAHGTGTLVRRIFTDSSSIVSLRTHNFYDGTQNFGAAEFCLPFVHGSRVELTSTLQIYMNGSKVRRALCIPYLPTEAVVSLAAKELYGMPLCTYVMDDKNVSGEGISDALMKELLTKSDLRLVIGPEMRDAYEKRYGMKFWVVPPLVPDAVIRTTLAPSPAEGEPKRGVLLGNIWGQRWLDLLRKTFRGTGQKVDWYCNTKDPKMLNFDRAEMEKDGIRLMDPVPESELPSTLGRYSYAVVPTDPLDGHSPSAVEAIARFSLPSRIPTLVTTSQLPVLVIGNASTSAARFVERFQVGRISPYNSQAVLVAIEQLLDSKAQQQIRERSLALSPSFSARNSADWIWRSLAQGSPCDLRYESLMPSLSSPDSSPYSAEEFANTN